MVLELHYRLAVAVVSQQPFEQEEAEEIVSVDYEGESLEVGFNVTYLQDVLSVIDDDRVRITLNDSNSSAVIEDPSHEDATYVVMPMKL